MDLFTKIAGEMTFPRVVVHGRTTDAEYDAIVSNSHVGLALKPNFGHLAYSTFPSKVIELSNAGLIILTTDISDVRKILGPHALYVKSSSPQELVDHFMWIEQHRENSKGMAQRGAQAVRDLCDPRAAGRSLSEFLYGSAD